MVSPIQPGRLTIGSAARSAATTPGTTTSPGTTTTPGSGSPTGGSGSGRIIIAEQRSIIQEADAQGSGTQGDGLSTRDDIYNYLMSKEPQSGDSTVLASYQAHAAAKADALVKTLDVSHGDHIGGDGLVRAGDVDNYNKDILFTYTVPNNNGDA